MMQGLATRGACRSAITAGIILATLAVGSSAWAQPCSSSVHGKQTNYQHVHDV
jgi:hypothetical protein